MFGKVKIMTQIIRNHLLTWEELQTTVETIMEVATVTINHLRIPSKVLLLHKLKITIFTKMVKNHDASHTQLTNKVVITKTMYNLFRKEHEP